MLSIDTVRRFIQTHPRKVAIVAAAVIVYAALNVWVFRYATSGRVASPMEAIKSGGFPSAAPKALETKPTATPTPTPRLTGPGTYACSPEGVCNLYSDQMRKDYCTQTYADALCLDQCADPAKRCSR